MENQKESVSLVEDYLGIGRRTLYILLAIAACALVATTGIYIAIYGFQHWKTNMNRAGAATVINFDAPTAAPIAAQYVCPNCGVVELPICPICGGHMSLR